MSIVIVVAVFTALIHLSESLAVSIRLAGIKTKQVATSISFVNVAFLISRLSNMFQAPLLGIMVDISIRNQTTALLEGNFRKIIFAAFIGNALGMFLIPWASRVAEKAIKRFQQKGSVPLLFWEFLNPKTIIKVIRLFCLPHIPKDLWKSIKRLPKMFWILNIFMVAIYAVGVLSSLYAGAQLPHLRTTATQLSGIVNGMATILLALLVDPTGAQIVDQVVHGKRDIQDAKAMVFLLSGGRLLATLIVAQAIFLPATKYIMGATNYMVSIAEWFGKILG